MYDRFTDRARKVMLLANQEAQQTNHEYIGTEHILLGLVAEGEGVAGQLLKRLGIDLSRLRQEVEKFVQRGRASAGNSNLPQTPRAKKVIEYSLEEAHKLNHHYVGTEHLLLGVLRETEGIAAQVLLNLGLVLEQVRKEVLNLLGHELGESPMAVTSHHTADESIPGSDVATLIAADIGNSRIKLGRFARVHSDGPALPEPNDTLDLPTKHATGEFDAVRLAAWCEERVGDQAQWLVASVHRGAAARLRAAVGELATKLRRDWRVRELTYRDVPLAIHVNAPQRVGIDRLVAAVAADRLRRPDRAAIIVDAGTAITVDLVDENGAFCGGAILPGIAMSARALAEQTDALPRVPLEHLGHPPAALGKSTMPAVESGLYWGAVGAIRELIHRLAGPLGAPPDVLLTGGASPDVAEVLAASESWSVHHVPHLVLSGIALVGASTSGRAGG